MKIFYTLALGLSSAVLSVSCAQPQAEKSEGVQKASKQVSSTDRRPPPPPRNLRKHTTTQINDSINLYPATESPITDSQFEAEIEGEWRIIKSNAIADHKTGAFPNLGNPNSISAQSYTIKVPSKPELTDSATKVMVPGWALNGVPFDPSVGEFYQGNPSLGWQYNALSGAIELGLDENHAHVQPTGKYHYHGLPTLLFKKYGVVEGRQSPQIGWAVDGFPIYALYGSLKNVSSGTSVKTLSSSYQIKPGPETLKRRTTRRES